MSTMQRYQHHERLMTRMADANGVDLELKKQMGEVSSDAYQTYVERCTGCSDPEGCQAHLQGAVAGFPSFCRNADTILRLAEATPSSD